MISYLIDSNVFIQAKNLHYGFDFCPAFWDWMVQQNSTGKVASIMKVRDELYVGNDNLAKWAASRSAGFFLPTSEAVSRALNKVSDWANNNDYESGAVESFFGKADYWLVAHALALNCIVVTHENLSNSIRKIKIPNACNGLKLRYMNPYEMLRQEGAKFLLGARVAVP